LKIENIVGESEKSLGTIEHSGAAAGHGYNYPRIRGQRMQLVVARVFIDFHR
jgi:hypothetical protein